MAQSHLIHKLSLHLSTTNKESVFSLQNEFSQLYHDDLEGILEQLSEQEILSDEHWVVEKLELDLGRIQKNELREKFISRLKQKFSEKFGELRDHQGGGTQWVRPIKINLSESNEDPDDESSNRISHNFSGRENENETPLKNEFSYHLEIFEHFLTKGSLPWWVNSKTFSSISKCIDFLWEKNPEEFISSLQILLKEKSALRRMIHQFSNKTIGEWVNRIGNFHLDWNSIFKSVREFIQQEQNLIQGFERKKEIIWGIIWKLADDRNQELNQINIIQTLWQTLSDDLHLDSKEKGFNKFIELIRNESNGIDEEIINEFSHFNNELELDQIDKKNLLKENFIKKVKPVNNVKSNSPDPENDILFKNQSEIDSNNLKNNSENKKNKKITDKNIKASNRDKQIELDKEDVQKFDVITRKKIDDSDIISKKTNEGSDSELVKKALDQYRNNREKDVKEYSNKKNDKSDMKIESDSPTKSKHPLKSDIRLSPKSNIEKNFESLTSKSKEKNLHKEDDEIEFSEVKDSKLSPDFIKKKEKIPKKKNDSSHEVGDTSIKIPARNLDLEIQNKNFQTDTPLSDLGETDEIVRKKLSDRASSVKNGLNPQKIENWNENKGFFEEEFFESGENFVVENSGLVILWPYFKTYFQTLGLTTEGDFIDDQAREKGVHLLQYLAAKTENSEEHQLMLNKILCGWPIKKSINRFVNLSEKEKNESDDLLNAVIKNWDVLKSISIESLRQTFINRNGILEFTDSGWVLKVEKGPIDMLMDKMPWGIGMIKTTWMKSMLQVDW